MPSSVDQLFESAQPAKAIDALKRENARLSKIVDQYASTIERMRKVKVKSPEKRGKVKGKKSFVRLIFGDAHGAHMNPGAIAAFLADVEVLRPKEIVCIGDILDCGGFLSQHKTLGVVAELAVTYEEDVASANMLLDELQARAPGAPFAYIEGNHENRINRWICDQVLGNAANAEFLRRLFGTSTVLGLEKRGVRYIERHKYYDGLSISGTIKLEPFAVAQHGEAYCGKYAMFRHLESLGKSVFFGHTHRLSENFAENLGGTMVAVNTGCLCERRPLYGLTKTTNWTHGYVAQIVLPGHGYLAVPIPIVNGISYLQPLAEALKL